ncbi:MAG: hypothetical protein ACRYFZ_06905 [Janthinobacterium lividum]
MKRLFCSLVLLGLSACGGATPDTKTPQEAAITRFVKTNLRDSASYAPTSIARGIAFTKRDAQVEAFEPIREAAEDNLPDELDKALSQRDTIAYLHTLDRLAATEKQYMRLYCRPSGKPVGRYYTHRFSYKDKGGKDKHSTTTFQVYDSLTLVRLADSTEFPAQ